MLYFLRLQFLFNLDGLLIGDSICVHLLLFRRHLKQTKKGVAENGVEMEPSLAEGGRAVVIVHVKGTCRQ